MSAVNPREDEQQRDNEREGGGREEEEDTFKKVFGESMDEALREMGAKGFGARARKAEAFPSKKEVEEHTRCV